LITHASHDYATSASGQQMTAADHWRILFGLLCRFRQIPAVTSLQSASWPESSDRVVSEFPDIVAGIFVDVRSGHWL
jgi:hypothetical protein